MINNLTNKDIKEIVLYLVVGLLTTLVSVSSYFFFTRFVSLGIYSANIISWMIAVLFAFFANKKIVYKDKGQIIIKGVIFLLLRACTLGMEMVLLYCGIKKLGIYDLAAKIIVQVFVVAGNYILGKFIVFKNYNMKNVNVSGENGRGEDSGNN